MTQFHPFSGKPVPPPSPFGRPVTGPEAVTRSRLSGWDAGVVIVDEVQAHLDHRRALRRARANGMILGAAVSLVAFTAGIILRAVIEAYWPVACDGTGSLIVCGLRLVEVAA